MQACSRQDSPVQPVSTYRSRSRSPLVACWQIRKGFMARPRSNSRSLRCRQALEPSNNISPCNKTKINPWHKCNLRSRLSLSPINSSPPSINSHRCSSAKVQLFSSRCLACQRSSKACSRPLHSNCTRQAGRELASRPNKTRPRPWSRIRSGSHSCWKNLSHSKQCSSSP